MNFSHHGLDLDSISIMNLDTDSTISTQTQDGSRKETNIHDLDGFIHAYKLGKIEDALRSEEVTIDFLLSQSMDQIKEIAKELSTKLIQQNKFIYAVQQIQKSQSSSTNKQPEYPDEDDEKQIENV